MVSQASLKNLVDILHEEMTSSPLWNVLDEPTINNVVQKGTNLSNVLRAMIQAGESALITANPDRRLKLKSSFTISP